MLGVQHRAQLVADDAPVLWRAKQAVGHDDQVGGPRWHARLRRGTMQLPLLRRQWVTQLC